MHKIWHKPLHKRKVWKQMSLLSKTIYYMKPFAGQILNTWLQPLPFPTILKCLYSGFLMVIMLLPVIYPITIMVCYYGIIQYLIESNWNIRYTHNLDLIHFLDELFKYQVENQNYASFVNQYLERWRYAVAAMASCVDYVRLGLSMIMG